MDDTHNDYSLDRIISYWDDRSPNMNAVRMRELSSVNCAAWSKFLSTELPPRDNLHILDVGTGVGFLAIILAKLNHNVVGVDLSTSMIDFAAANAEKSNVVIDYRVMSADNISLPAESFDAIITRNLTWTLDNADACYLEWLRLLKDRGMLINIDSDYGGFDFKLAEAPNDIHKDITNEQLDFYNAVKAKLAISKRSRPDWDIGFLESRGMTVSCTDDIRSLVHIDDNFLYDDVPLFCIKAIKN